MVCENGKPWVVEVEPAGRCPYRLDPVTRPCTYSMACTEVYFEYFVILGAFFVHLFGNLYGSIFRIFREFRERSPVGARRCKMLGGWGRDLAP